MADPYGKFGQVYTGPGFRLPFYIVSPWTRGGNVFVEHADHISQIKFVEEWLASKGINATSAQVPSWRREHMSDLVKAFDFDNPNYSLPSIPTISPPTTDSTGTYNGYAVCEATYPTQRPPVPYGQQTVNNSLVSEDGFKVVRGALTEGRYLIFEVNGYALAATTGGKCGGTKTTAAHDSKAQRWVAHQQNSGGATFTLSSAVNGAYLATSGVLVSGAAGAAIFTITDLGNGKGYTLSSSAGFASLSKNGELSFSKEAIGFKVYSVTYST